MDYDIQIEETSGYEAYQQQLELQQWAKDEARKLYNTYNAILANAWPGDEHEAMEKLEQHCSDFGICIDTLDYEPMSRAEYIEKGNPVVKVLDTDDIPF